MTSSEPVAARPRVPGQAVKGWSSAVAPIVKPPVSFFEFAVTITGMPQRVDSATSFIALIQVAIRAPVGSSRMMKWRMCSAVIISVVPSKGMPALVWGSSLIGRYCSSSAPSWLVKSLVGWEMPIGRELMTIRPSFSSGDMRATRSAARSTGLSRQSSNGVSSPSPSRSRKRRPSTSRIFLTRLDSVIWAGMGAPGLVRDGSVRAGRRAGISR